MQKETIKLFDSELKIMNVLWSRGDVPAKYIAEQLTREIGWNKNTTYTLIKRCIKKVRLKGRSRILCVMPRFQKKPCSLQKQMS